MSVNIVVFRLRYLNFLLFVLKRLVKLGCSTILTPRCVVTLVVLLDVARPMFHLSDKVSGETPFLLLDVIELVFTLSDKDEVKSSSIISGLITF